MSRTRKITYSASIAAMVAVAVSLSRFAPVSLMVLSAAAVLFCAQKCGFFYGLAALTAGTGMAAIADYLSAGLFLLVFGTYILAFILTSKLAGSKRPPLVAARYLVMLILFNAAAIASAAIAPVFFVDTGAVIARFGAALLIIAVNAAFIVIDFLICRILPLLDRAFERRRN